MKALLTALAPWNLFSLHVLRERKFLREIQKVVAFLLENRLVATLSSIGLKVSIHPGRISQREVLTAEKSRKIWISLDMGLEEDSISSFPSSSQERSIATHTSPNFPRLGVMHPDWFFRTSHTGWRFVSISDQEIRSSLASRLVDATTYSFVRSELSQFLNVPSFQLISGRGKFREKLVPGVPCESLPPDLRIQSLLTVAHQLRDHYLHNPKIFSCDFRPNSEIAKELNNSGGLERADIAPNLPRDLGDFIPLIASHGDIAIQNMVLNDSDINGAEAPVTQENHGLIKGRIFMVDFENCGLRPFWADASALVLQLAQHGYCEESALELFSELVAPFGFAPGSSFPEHRRNGLVTLKVMAESRVFQLHEVRRARGSTIP